ncbi:hypothetical protein ASPWEDRAFT_52843 [Aspergillus wentii DTO 134E9]|uniref:PET hydrolase/cutinase-like domain-containing protein n=1 Tax=Aspergillus wentii DTO 134E9 TaxID=1073089 RepID=A0A1L9RCL7_ASPWE|nr:uncharacterized protein ASPWEDRAFT_52843 [Aspergillus wentii DTO 134E9]OJJ32675.1 hypothetical protein ASPWEDRAFT_52843 [Aspergillus wentii DTO 134E9]
MSIEKVNFPSKGLNIIGNLYHPSTSNRKNAAIIVVHPMTSIKEQSPTTYATRLAAAGFFVLTYDAAYQGESDGEPRGLEDPFQRAEEVRSAVTFLSTRDEVDADRIGVLGICAAGGYACFAAQTDLRLKAVAGVSAVCSGEIMRTGLIENSSDRDTLLQGLKAAGEARIAEARGEPVQVNQALPATLDDVPKDAPHLYKELVDYYKTPRGQHSRAPGIYAITSLSYLANYDSFAFNEMVSPRPVLMIAGSDSATRYYSERAMEKTREPKELFIINGQTHAGLYDDASVSGPRLVDFFGSHLSV